MITLPTSKVPATSTNPKFLILYGRPKCGKTSALAQLDDNLIIDLEGGSTFIDAMAVQARSVSDFGEIAQAIRAKNAEVGHNFYRHITIDNATRLEEICLGYAATLYKKLHLVRSGREQTSKLFRTDPGIYIFAKPSAKLLICSVNCVMNSF